MKTTIVLFCAVLLAACGAPEKKVRVISEVEDGTPTSVTYGVFKRGFTPEMCTETAEKSGENSYIIPDDDKVYVVTVVYNDRPEQVRYLLLTPGDDCLTLYGRLNLETNAPSVRFRGTELFDALYRELDQVDGPTKRFSSLQRKYMSGAELTPGERTELDSLAQWTSDYIVDRIRNHPESPVTAYHLMTRMFPDSCYRELYYSVPEEIRNGKYKPLYDELLPEEDIVKTAE